MRILVLSLLCFFASNVYGCENKKFEKFVRNYAKEAEVIFVGKIQNSIFLGAENGDKILSEGQILEFLEQGLPYWYLKVDLISVDRVYKGKVSEKSLFPYFYYQNDLRYSEKFEMPIEIDRVIHEKASPLGEYCVFLISPESKEKLAHPTFRNTKSLILPIKFEAIIKENETGKAEGVSSIR